MAAQEWKIKDLSSLDLKPGEKKEIELEGLDSKVLLLNDGSKVQAIGPRCTHYGAPLVKGVLSTNGRLTCPWHGACFNAKTGDVEDAPALDALPTFKVTERDGAFYLIGDKETIKAGRRKPPFKTAVKTGPAVEKVVVVGGGSGACGVVEGLRGGGFDGSLTMISNEGYLPIDRTKLSKSLMTDLSKLQWRDLDFYKSGKVDVVEDEVTDVDFQNKTVSTKKGEKYPYTKLVLATGGTPKNLPLPGFQVLENIFLLRSVHDAKKIVEAIGEEKGKKIVVIGSSFIGLEVGGATASDNNVTIVGMEKTPLERVLGEEVGSIIQKGMEGKGLKFYMDAGVEKAEPSTADPKKVGAVVLKDGTRLEADLVILGVGVSPATGYLQKNNIIKLADDGSVVVDDVFAVTGIKDVYAIGDIATYPYNGPGGDGRYTRIEHWNVAQNAGRAVASRIINPSRKPDFFTPVFWSALHSQLRYCGNTTHGYDEVAIQGKLSEDKWAAFYCKGETVVAVATMGMDPVMSQSAQLMRVGRMPTKSELKPGVLLDGLDVLSLGPPE
jgi:NADPH-dependent 2,4-dienoyl-CoA reductase/sulfur reductase-like enzyme/nitrite reductase/ring-hydroxylating ferredoxin subunit